MVTSRTIRLRRKPKKLADSLLLLIEGVYVTSQLFGEDGPAAAARRLD